MRPLCLKQAWALPIVTCGALLAFAPPGAVSARAPAYQAQQRAQPAAKTPAGKLPPAREIIDRYIKEIGGRAAVLGRSSMHIIGTVSMPAAGINGKMETFHAKPNLYLQRLSMPGIGEMEEGFDGKVGWTRSPLTGPTLVEGKQLEERAFDADFYDELKAPDRYASMTTVEQTLFEERPVYKVRLVKKAGGEDFEFYDVETGLKAGSVSTRETPMGALQGTTAYGDYKKYGVLRQPTTMKMTTLNVQMVMSVLAMEYDTVDTSVFAPPPQIKALIK
jgi:hypothetical protein